MIELLKTKRILEMKSEQDELPQQFRLVESRMRKPFSFRSEHRELIAIFRDDYSHGLVVKPNGVFNPYSGQNINFKEDYPTQYQAFFAELRKIRSLESEAIDEFLDPQREQQYPIFLPEWYNGRRDYDNVRKDLDWVKYNQSYFNNHQLDKELFPEIPETGNVFYSHTSTGTALSQLAKLYPHITIDGTDAVKQVGEKCKRVAREQGVTNLRRVYDLPAEYLTSISTCTYDAVYTFEAVWQNPYRAFAEYCRILKPNGLLVGCTSGGDHDTSIFFRLFGSIYGAKIVERRNADFRSVVAKITPEVKDQLQIDTTILNLIFGQITPEGEDSKKLPQHFHEEFKVYSVDKELWLKQFSDLGYSFKEASQSLRRLEEVAKYGRSNQESSFCSIAIVSQIKS